MAASLEAQQVEKYDLQSGSSRKAGRVVILSHFRYIGRRNMTRVGTHKDELELFQVFNTLHFETFLHRDLSKQEIQEKLQYYSSEDYTNYGCFILVVLTHGDDDGRLCASDQSYHISETWTPFIDSRTLQDKPKIFIYQACRTSLNNATQELHYQCFDGPGPGSESIKPYTPDFLLAFSTMEGQLSNRSQQQGTWYIQTLCQQLYFWAGGQKDILQVLTEVNARVVRERVKTNKDGVMTGQTPTFISFLHKRVVTTFENVYDTSLTVNLQTEIKRLKELLLSNTSENTMSDHVAGHEDHLLEEQRLETSDTSGTISAAPEEIYELPVAGSSAGVALIYHDQEFSNKAEQMNTTLSQLQFETAQKMTSASLLTDIENDISEPSVASAACLILTFITTMQESVMTDFNINFIDIWNKLTVTSCPILASKPKLLLFINLDKMTDRDDADCPTTANISEYANDHSDFIIFYGYGKTIFDSLNAELRKCSQNAQDVQFLLMSVMKCVTSSNTKYLSHYESTLTRKLLLGGYRDTSAPALTQTPRFVNKRPPVKQNVNQNREKPNQRYLDAQEHLKKVMTPNPKVNPVLNLHNRLLEKANDPHNFQGSVFQPRPQSSSPIGLSGIPSVLVNNGIIANTIHGASTTSGYPGAAGTAAYGQDVGMTEAQRRKQVELQKKLLKAQQDQFMQDQIMNIMFRK